MTDTQDTSLAGRLAARFGDTLSIRVERNETIADVRPADLIAVATALRDEAPFRFGQLIDLCGIDYLGYGQSEWETNTAAGEGFSRGVEGEAVGRFSWANRPHPGRDPRRFAAVIQLLSIEHNHRLRLRVFCEDDTLPVMPSVTGVWPGSNWFEREAFDLYGILFEGHPDMRRILTDYGFVGHPFRKDFPLSGHVEMRYDPVQQRVIYQPVSIEPREITPRIVREEHYGEGR